MKTVVARALLSTQGLDQDLVVAVVLDPNEQEFLSLGNTRGDSAMGVKYARDEVTAPGFTGGETAMGVKYAKDES